MKKLSLCVLFFLLVFACGKEEMEIKHCWKCEVSVTYYPGGTGSSFLTICDKSEKEIVKVEAQGTSTTTATVGKQTVTVQTRTKCIKKD